LLPDFKLQPDALKDIKRSRKQEHF
jgi:hypothetical protein